MVEFRRSLAASFLFKGLLFVAHQLEAEAPGYESPFPASYRSGGWRVVCRRLKEGGNGPV